jgi:tetratricopeptide (TPR) repeat protein
VAKTKLQAARQRIDGYTQQKAVDDLLRLAHTRNIPVMTRSAMLTKISVWENGHEQVSELYQRLFRELYGRTNEELGFPPENEDEEAEELLSRLTLARTVDQGIVEMFARQVDEARRVDRRFGGVTQLDGLRSLITQVENLLHYNTVGGHRTGLAGVLTEASALAGWEALDRNAIRSAWDHHETAKAAAREADSPLLLAHSTAQQAFILIDLEQIDLAVGQLAEARELAARVAPGLLRAWLAAAHGEGLAAAGRRDEALRAFDAAGALLPTDPVDPALPFLFLGGGHLDRWRGNALSKLGEPTAIDQLTEALPRLPADFNRARAGMLVDLAFAHAAAGERDTALDYSRQAKRLASQIKSDRQLRRLSGLILPT